MKINAYLKPQCGWSMGVRAIMNKYSLEYTDLDIINNPQIYAEMVEKSGQPLSPCVEIDVPFKLQSRAISSGWSWASETVAEKVSSRHFVLKRGA